MTTNLPEIMVFDWDGTLADSFVFLNAAHNYVRDIFDMDPMSEEEFKYYFGKPREVLYNHMYQSRAEEAKTHFETYVVENHHRLEPLEGAGTLLASLQEAGVTMCVVTNKRSKFVTKEIKNMGWNDYFVSIVGAGEAGEDKPSTAPLLHALQKAELEDNPDKIWFIGDTDIDLECAQNFGCKAVLIGETPERQSWIEYYKPMMAHKTLPEFHASLFTAKAA
jgi:phosphoglycolate phosphatase